MAKFQPGQPRPPGSGRPKGGKNKKTLLRVDAILADKGVHPVDEILKLLPNLPARDALVAWMELLKWCQPRFKDVAPAELPPDDDLPELPATKPSQLLQSIQAQQLKPANDNTDK